MAVSAADAYSLLAASAAAAASAAVATSTAAVISAVISAASSAAASEASASLTGSRGACPTDSAPRARDDACNWVDSAVVVA